MQIVACIRREGTAAIYQHGDKQVRCEHVRSDEPWDLMTQARLKVLVSELDKRGRATGRSITVRTSSYDAAALQAFGIGDTRIQHFC